MSTPPRDHHPPTQPPPPIRDVSRGTKFAQRLEIVLLVALLLPTLYLIPNHPVFVIRLAIAMGILVFYIILLRIIVWSIATHVFSDWGRLTQARAAKEILVRSITSGDYQKAITEYQALLANDPHNTLAHMGLGGTFLELKRYEECIECMEQVLAEDVHPNLQIEERAHALLAAALRGLGRLTEAETHIQNALATKYRLAPIHYVHARILADCGRFDEAEEALKTARKLLPQFPLLFLQAKQVRAKMREELAEAREYVESHPDRSTPPA